MWFHSTLDVVMMIMALVLTLKVVMIIILTIILHLAMDAEEFDEGRTVMVVITGGVNSSIPPTLSDNTW